jgi:hypothetical protein
VPEVALPQFDPSRTDYSPEELEAYANQWLWDDREQQKALRKERREEMEATTSTLKRHLLEKRHEREPLDDVPDWLTADEYLRRQRREIYNKEGVPDPSIVEGLYWRVFPGGRKFNAKRKSNEGFYRP